MNDTECSIPGGVMYSDNRGLCISDAERRRRLRAVLKWELEAGRYSNAWVTLHWLTFTLPQEARKKVRLSKSDAALLLLETEEYNQRNFVINWSEVTCV